MIKDVQQTVITDVQDSVRKMLSVSIDSDNKEEMIDIALQTIEVTILNAFWKHGISGSAIRTNKGENL
jgi:hypothetical protein